MADFEIDHYLSDYHARWYVVFCDATSRRWWDIFTCKGFSHVYVMLWDGRNWLLFNPSTTHTDMLIVYHDNCDILSVVQHSATIVSLPAYRVTDGKRGRLWCGVMTCVEQVKALLGISRFIVTPKQLYDHLTRGNNYGVIQKTENTGTDGAGTGVIQKAAKEPG